MTRAAIAALLFLLVAVPAHAGSVGGMVASWSTDEADDDTGLGLKLDLDMGQRVDFEIRASFFDNLLFPETVSRYEIEAGAVDLGVGYDFPMRRATPYVGFGLSYVVLKVDQFPQFDEPARIKDEAGWYALVGFEVAMRRNSEFFLEAGYRALEAEIRGNDLTGLVVLGVDLSGPMVNAGLQIAW